MASSAPAVAISRPSLGVPSLEAFFRTLPGDFRNTVGRMTRRLCRAGRVEVVSCSDPSAARALLDLYLDLEQRSWKIAAKAGITRNPERLAFFESLCAPDQKLELVYDFILLDGVPIAAMMSGIFLDLYYAFETTYDSAYGDLSPGTLTWLMAIRHGIARGLRSYNLQNAYSYYKERWNGLSTPTQAVQVFRVPSLPFLKAQAGAWKRRLLRSRTDAVLYNEAKRAVEVKPSGEPGSRPPRVAEAALAERILDEIARSGVILDRFTGESLAGVLPFSIESSPQQKGARKEATRFRPGPDQSQP
jgi:CelD/BcsL family acetyltransferase involved in cellulose biosynthesis